MVYRYEGNGVWKTEAAEVTSDPGEPSLVLTPQMAEEMVRAAQGFVHADDATVKHLNDTIAVRDRLLSLVEKCPVPR